MKYFLLFLLVCFSLNEIPVFKTSCSKHYDCFFQVGKFFQDQITSFIDIYPAMNATLLPFYEKEKHLFEQFCNTIKTNFPEYYDEIRGIAEGAGIEFHYIMLMILKIEILAYEKEYKAAENEGCTDIHYSSSFRGHNEDGWLGCADKAYFVDVEIGDSEERLFFYNYPALLPGNAYGWNKHGLVFSENAISPKEVFLTGVPTYILTRHIVSMKSVDEILTMLNSIKPAFGFNMNVFDPSTKEHVAVEVSPEAIGFRHISGNYSHMNNYKFLNVKARSSTSTVHRQARVDEFDRWSEEKDILAILGDTKDPEYPLYRKDDHGTSTLSTVFFNFEKLTADIYTENPKDHEKEQCFPLTFSVDCETGC